MTITAKNLAIKPKSNVSKIVNDKEVKKELSKTNLIKFFNKSHDNLVDKDVKNWKKIESGFKTALSGLVSPQFCELYSIVHRINKKGIKLISPDGEIYDTTDIETVHQLIIGDIKDSNFKNMAVSRVRFYKKFLGVYSSMLDSLSNGETDIKNISGIVGKEGKQLIAFINYLNENGYKFK